MPDTTMPDTTPDTTPDTKPDTTPDTTTPDPSRPDVSQNPEKDPADWVTGDEPATGPQQSYLHTLAQEAGEDVPADLSKADASREIDRLQGETGRG